MAKGAYQVPFRNGNLLHYPDSWPTLPEWRDNYEFSATLTFAGFSRGRSAAYLNFMNPETGEFFPMFLADLSDVLTRCTLEKGKVNALWTFCKRGQNYGICLASTGQRK